MSPQRVATGIGMLALAALLISVGLPPLLSPAQVAEIRIEVPEGHSPVELPPARVDGVGEDDLDEDDPDDSDDSPDDGDGDISADDSPDDD